MKKIVCFVGSMDTGGAETFLMKIFRKLDKEKYSMDFIVSKKGVYDDEIKRLGGKVYFTPLKSTNLFKHILVNYHTMKKEKYDAALAMTFCNYNVIDLIIAKFAGIKKLVLRSTNAGGISDLKKIRLNKLCKSFPKIIPNVKIAPSKLAGAYLFGEEAMKNGEVKIINNGLDISQFKFSEEERKKYRKDLGIENKFVIGHVGRFSHQKNHDFLIDVFYEVVKKREDAVLLLVGKGELQENIEKKVKGLGLTEKVKFLGVRSDVNKLLNAMDVFLFPSFYEGMPNTVIEAQTNGLPCLIADTITEEAQITDLVAMYPLSAEKEKWCDKVLELNATYKTSDRSIVAQNMIDNGYDIEDCANEFIKIIFSDNFNIEK